MHRFLSGLTLLALVASADEAPKAIQYARFRYTGFGVADPDRDLKIVETFKSALAPRPQPETATVLTAEAKDARIAALEKELATPLPSSASRAEQLRRTARVSELARLRTTEPVVSSGPKQPTGQNVVALVDTIPNSIDVRDGRIGTTDTGVEILGHYAVRTQWAENEARLLPELKLLAEIAGGNVLLISYLHDREPQGQCQGATGLIVRDPNFAPKKVTRGRLPTEI